MAKSIRSYPASERRAVIARRIDRKSGGLGYWAAIDAQKHQGGAKKKEVVQSTSNETPLDSK